MSTTASTNDTDTARGKDADTSSRSEQEQFLFELDARLDAIGAVAEEVAINQQRLADCIERTTDEKPKLETEHMAKFIVSQGAAGPLTTLLASRRTFTLFAKCCIGTCSFTLG